MDFTQFKVRSTRKDVLANNNAHYFSYRFSKYIAYSFYKIGFSANAVTWFFLLFGIQIKMKENKIDEPTSVSKSTFDPII